MRSRPLLLIATAFALLSCAATSRAQQQDQKVIDDFVTSRGVTFDVPATKTARPQRQAAHTGTAARRAGVGGAKNTGAGGVASGGKGASSAKASTAGAAPNRNGTAGDGATVSAGGNSAGANGAGVSVGGAQTAKVSAD